MRGVRRTALSRNTGKVVLVILEIAAFKSHKSNHGCLLGARRHAISVKRLGYMRDCLFRSSAFPGCGGIVARIGRGCNSLELRHGEGRIISDTDPASRRCIRQQGHDAHGAQD